MSIAETTPATTGPNVSVVIPVYNSRDCVEKLLESLTSALNANNRSHEIILVNDASPDGTWQKIQEVAPKYPALRAFNLRRNFGQDNALMAGLARARGQVAVIMDDDLQHDPADMEKLVSKVEQGADVCYAKFVEKRQQLWKNCGSWFNDKVANIVLNKPKGVYLSPYKAIASEVVREVLEYQGPYPYVDGLIFRVTTNITQVQAEHHARFAGRSNYSVVRSVRVWLRLATSFSLAPLRLATYMGFVCSAIGLLMALFFALRKLLAPGTPMGWASTIVAILVLGGIQLASLGLIGEYLGRVFIHLNKRPQYVIRDSLDKSG
jgi:undecaprenyl-phosphate 4-deoxy-4-formamido-L-arabinose transferase